MIAAVQYPVDAVIGYLVGNKNAAVTQDAARHVQLYLITNINLLECTAVKLVTGFGSAVLVAKILQMTLTCLIADRAIQWVIDQ